MTIFVPLLSVKIDYSVKSPFSFYIPSLKAEWQWQFFPVKLELSIMVLTPPFKSTKEIPMVVTLLCGALMLLCQSCWWLLITCLRKLVDWREKEAFHILEAMSNYCLRYHFFSDQISSAHLTSTRCSHHHWQSWAAGYTTSALWLPTGTRGYHWMGNFTLGGKSAVSWCLVFTWFFQNTWHQIYFC